MKSVTRGCHMCTIKQSTSDTYAKSDT